MHEEDAGENRANERICKMIRLYSVKDGRYVDPSTDGFAYQEGFPGLKVCGQARNALSGKQRRMERYDFLYYQDFLALRLSQP